MDLEAIKIAELTGVSRNSVNKILKALRERLAQYCESQSSFSGKVGLDASCKASVFGILKTQGMIYTQIVPGCSREFLRDFNLGKADLESIDKNLFNYDAIVDLEYKRHYRVNLGNDESASKKSQLNGIENFWGMAKTRLSRFRGLNKNTFYLHIKETEFRFNHRHDDLYKLMLQMLRNEPLKLS